MKNRNFTVFVKEGEKDVFNCKVGAPDEITALKFSMEQLIIYLYGCCPAIPNDFYKGENEYPHEWRKDIGSPTNIKS